MLTKNNRDNSILIRLCQLILLIFLLLPFSFVKADLIDDLNKQIQEQEKKRIELEQQAQEYQNVINQKNTEIKSLNNQIAIFNAQIGKVTVEITITEDDIGQTKLEITQLEYGLEKTEEDITEDKQNLSDLIQTIAEYDQTTDLEIILQSKNFSEYFNQKTYIESLQKGIQIRVENLRLLKNKMEQDKESKEEKKEELEDLKTKLTDQKWTLASQRNSKESLLQYTRGEEKKYQQMLTNIEKQKQELLGDINRLRQQKAAELARLKELQEKPPAQYWASTNWYYQQDDPRWAKTTIGFSDSRMEDFGCAIASVAMVFTENGSPINPGRLAKESIFYYDLIVWPQRWGSVSCINCPPVHTSSFDYFRLDRELGAGNPVIVFIRAKGRNGGHYVVVHHKTDDGRYVVHDPLFGANIYLDSTQVYISNLYNTTTYLDQMVIYH